MQEFERKPFNYLGISIKRTKIQKLVWLFSKIIKLHKNTISGVSEVG